jgi:hypothetical protein
MSQADELNQQITQAISAHGLWKSRLSKAIETGTSEFDVATVNKDDQCPFGKWLYTGIAPNSKRSAHYEAVRKQHAEFHKQASQVLSLALAKKTEQAKTAMGLASDYSKASALLTKAMMKWRDEEASK